MSASAQRIHDALQAVVKLRRQHVAEPELRQAGALIKRFQARRFMATYRDLLQSPRYKSAAQFFLHELYGDKDYADRDDQFARIANTIARLFPQAVVDTAAALAEVHALTEYLDDLMARQRLQLGAAADASTDTANACATYIDCWQRVADPAARHRQLEMVLVLGRELDRLTKKPGLRTMLRLMRGPATAAGLGALQHFLETGFDAFAAMHGAGEFLQVIEQRETKWIGLLFGDDPVACAMELARLMGTGADN